MQKVSSGSPYEASIGFSRAIRVGDRIMVSGTAPLNPDGTSHAPDDVYLQAKRCLEIILKAIHDLGGTADDVVRTRMYLVSAEDWLAVGQAHGEVFANIRPVATQVVVAGLLRPEWRIEMEAEAIISR